MKGSSKVCPFGMEGLRLCRLEDCMLYNTHVEDCNLNLAVKALCDISDACKRPSKYPHHVVARPNGFTMYYADEDELDGQDDMQQM